MARRREGFVRESEAELEELTHQIDGTARRARLRLLIAIKQNPNATFDELARLLDYSERNIHRWWSHYLRGGIESLIADGRQNLDVTHQAEFRSPLAAQSPQPETSLTLAPRIARFLNQIPTTFDAAEWMQQFHSSLVTLLDDVDVVMLRVNLSSNIEHPDEERASLVVVDQKHRTIRDNYRHRNVQAKAVESTPGSILISQAIESGFPPTHYQIPTVFDYYVDGTEYVGSIALWRERSKSPIPESTIALIKSLERFITFVLSDCVVRRMRCDPELRHFGQVIGTVAARIGLTGRELEVFSFQLFGANRAEIAERLGIALSTVGKHIARIHEKAGTKNYTELFTRYFKPFTGE